MTVIDKPRDEYALPPALIPFAIRLANEGVPLAVIARSFKQPMEIVRTTLDDAYAAGSLTEIPRADWPPTARRADRLPSNSPKPVEEEALLVNSMKVFGTTRVQGALLAVLLKRDEVSKETLHGAIEHQRMRRLQKPIDMENETDMKMVDVVICHLRKKLKPHNIAITTIRGFGFYMTRNDRHQALGLIRAALEFADAADSPG